MLAMSTYLILTALDLYDRFLTVLAQALLTPPYLVMQLFMSMRIVSTQSTSYPFYGFEAA